MRLVTLSLLALAMAAPPLAAQVVDTTAAARYYPLGIGDVWQYDVEQTAGGGFPIQWRYREERRVLRDTVLSGQAYRIVAIRRTNIPVMPSPPPANETRYVRFDAATATAVYTSGGGTSEWRVDGGGCRLDEAFPASTEQPRLIDCLNDPPGGTSFVEGGYSRSVLIGTQNYSVTEKRFSYFTFAWQHAEYAAGIGLLSGGGCEGGCYEETLRFASVGGRLYGAPFVAAEAPAPGVSLALSAAPNPSAGPLTLLLALPEAGAVTVDVFDALGRRVHHAAETLAAGAHTLPVDASAWAPGLYVVRATTAGETVALRLVRH